MFFRLKTSGQRGYVQIVENKRDGAAVRQRVIANLGRGDELAASGALASLIASGAKLTDQVLLINALDEDGEGALSIAAKRIGGPMLFDRIWERLGIGGVLDDLLKERGFEFPVERAVFVAALHRLFVSGSDRDWASWIKDYDIPGAEGLDLHHFYRAMAWLGEELEEKPDGALAPRCVKDLIEEKLFDRRHDLFTDLSAVFMDATSLSFYGEGGETLGEHGVARSRPPAAGAHPLSSRRLARAHQRRAGRRQAFQMRSCRPAVPRPPGPSPAASPVKIPPKTSRPTKP